MVFINSIDKLIDSSLDNFFKYFIIKDNSIFSSKLKKEKNFLKYQQQINELISDYITNVNKEDIKKIVNEENNVIKIINIIKRYVAYYMFLFISFFYKGDHREYMANLTEFTKHQSTTNFKIPDFFNAENNSTISKFGILLHLTIELLKMDESTRKTKLKDEIMKKKYMGSVLFLNSLDKDFVKKNFDTNLNENNLAHNMIKTLIFKSLYNDSERPKIHEILSSVEKIQGEYIYIDIVVQTGIKTDYKTLENLLDADEIRKGKAKQVYEFMESYTEQEEKDLLTIDQKILYLIEGKFITPITEDFLRYNKDSERSDKEIDLSGQNKTDKKTKKEDTKLKYIVTKIEKASELYSNVSPDQKKEIDGYFYPPLVERRAILFNDNDELKILNKLEIAGQHAIEQNEYYSDLLHYRLYPYINFKNFSGNGVTVQLNKTIEAVRSASFEFMNLPHVKNSQLQVRTGSSNYHLNIVGLIFNPTKTALQCIKTFDVRDVRSIKYKKTKKSINTQSNSLEKLSRSNIQNTSNLFNKKLPILDKPNKQKKVDASEESEDYVTSSKLKLKGAVKEKNDNTKYTNGYYAFLKYVNNSLLKNRGNFPVKWLFDLKKDKTNLEHYEQFGNMDEQEIMKVVLSRIYDRLALTVYEMTLKKLDNLKDFTVKRANKLVRRIYRDYLIIPSNHFLHHKILNYIFYKKRNSIEPEKDPNEYKYFDYDESNQTKEFKLVEAIKRRPANNNLLKITATSFDETVNKKIHQKKQLDLKMKKDIDMQDDSNENSDNVAINVLTDSSSICHHNLLWQQLAGIKRSDPTLYAEKLSEFIQEYGILTDNDYYCKSCSVKLDFNTYSLSGTFDDEGKFVAFETRLDIPLEDFEEYKKIKTIIPLIDKLVERIALISKISYYSGTNTLVKARRQPVTKSVIDTIIMHNRYLRYIQSERETTNSTKYNLNSNLSNLQVFTLDSSMFEIIKATSDNYKKNLKEKMLKQNNLYAYIIFIFLLEINDNQIVDMSQDKLCNYTLFNSSFKELFDDIKININNKGDTNFASKYKVLCYVVYIFSCCLIKSKLWNILDSKTEESKKSKNKSDTIYHKSIIITIFDLLNSILEVNSRQRKKYLYTVISSKFFSKLRMMYESSKLLMRIENINSSKLKKKTGIDHLSKVKNSLSETGTIKPGSFDYELGIKTGPLFRKFEYSFNLIEAPVDTSQNILRELEELKVMSNLTNCLDGKFHKWKGFENTLKCTFCNVKMNNLEYSEKDTTEIIENYSLQNIRNLSKKYCPDGSLHNFTENENGELISNKCGKKPEDSYTVKELRDLQKSRKKIETDNLEKKREIIKKINDQEKVFQTESQKYFADYFGKFKLNQNSFLENFMNNLKNIIGKDANLNNENTYFDVDTYIFDHDHFGVKLSSPIIIKNTNNQIKFKNNHSFFKKNVFYYVTKSPGSTEVYYDSLTHLFIGYKESNKNYVVYSTKKEIKSENKLNKSENKAQEQKEKNIFQKELLYAKINYSVESKIKQFGFPSRFISINNYLEDIKEEYPESTKSELQKHFIDKVIADRFLNLKVILNIFKKIIFEIKLGLVNKDGEDVYQSNTKTIKKLVDKYIKVIQNFSIGSIDNDNLSAADLFSEWKLLESHIKPTTENINPKKVFTDENDIVADSLNINNIDSNSNLLLYFLLNELTKLIKYNDNKFTKINLVNMFIDIINLSYNQFSNEKWISVYDITRFNVILDSGKGIIDAERKSKQNNESLTGLYGEDLSAMSQEEIESRKEANKEAQYEADALDYESDKEMAADDEFIRDYSVDKSD